MSNAVKYIVEFDCIATYNNDGFVVEQDHKLYLGRGSSPFTYILRDWKVVGDMQYTTSILYFDSVEDAMEIYKVFIEGLTNFVKSGECSKISKDEEITDRKLMSRIHGIKSGRIVKVEYTDVETLF